jgi:DNA-binding response OmpR family regulator
LSINQKEAARGFMTTLPTFGEKDEVYRKELREMIGVHDEKWAQGARGTWVDTPPAPTPPAPAAVPYANAPSTASKAAPLPGYPSSRQIKISAEEKAQFADLSILVVDDDPNICTLLTTAIKNIGCQVSTAPNGFEGVDMALRLKPTLIISDLLMPKMDGNQFFTKLQEYPETKDIPFVCLTSRGQEDEKLAAFERGVEDYWVKPFSIAEITMRIKKLMQRQLQQQRPTTSATAAPLSDQIELAGSLAELTPADLLRFTQVKHKTGLLQLKNGDITGVLAFYNGEVIDAKYANLTGEDALYTLLNWHQGTFTFHSQNVPPYRQIVATTDEILSRLMQRYDEEYYLREQLPAPNLTLALSDNFYHSLINAQFPRAIDRLIILFDGQHKLGDCIDQLRGDTEALRLVVDLYQKEMFTVQVNK